MDSVEIISVDFAALLSPKFFNLVPDSAGNGISEPKFSKKP
jgi:hypothetical protein